jgi:acyl-CoA synthetase (AMP-forming)/AMP-acid ligase II
VPGTGLRFLDRNERPTFVEWAEVLSIAEATGRGLAVSGVQPGDRVALVLPTGIEFFAAFFGSILAGAVPTPLYPPVRLGRLDEYHERTAAMLTASDSSTIVTTATIRRLLGRTIELANHGVPASGLRRCTTVAALRSTDDGGGLVTSSEDDLGLVQFSSGTTGVPRPVALSHRALQAQAKVIEDLMPDSAELTHAGVSWLPLYHDMGLVGCVLPALNRPGVLTLVNPEHFIARPSVWLRAISTYRATISPAPNFAYGLCVDRIRDSELEGVDLSSWKHAFNGAEPIAPSVLRSFTQRFGRWGLRPEAITPVYGMSEAALAVTFSDIHTPFRTVTVDAASLAEGHARPDGDGVELAVVGHPLEGFGVEVRSEDGDVLSNHEVGEVWVTGPSLMDGYLGRPELTAEVLRDGWLKSGDQGFLDHGELVLTGRSKDVLIVRGRKYPPHVVEQAVDGIDGVRTGCAAAVTHLPADGAIEELILLVEHRADANADQRTRIPDSCRRRVNEATGLLVANVVVLPPGTLPRTSSGKIRRSDALAQHRTGTLTPPDKVGVAHMGHSFVSSRIAYARLARASRRSGDHRDGSPPQLESDGSAN